MVLMDIPDYEAALDTCFVHLRQGGQFVLSLTHPCFEESDSDYQAKGYVAVKEYFQEYCIEQQWACRFHRPLSHYFNALLQRGGVIQAVVEPQLDEEHVQSVPEIERNLHVPGFIVVQVSNDDLDKYIGPEQEPGAKLVPGSEELAVCRVPETGGRGTINSTVL